jgi:DNA-binding XRE family transcriptional regulator
VSAQHVVLTVETEPRATFADVFSLLARKTTRGGSKTTGSTVTTWAGAFAGRFVKFRVTVRARRESHSFFCSSNARLPGGEAWRARLQGGHFLDVELLGADLSRDEREGLAALIEAQEAQDAHDAGVEARPVRVRGPGERLRTGHPGADAVPDAPSLPVYAAERRRTSRSARPCSSAADAGILAAMSNPTIHEQIRRARGGESQAALAERAGVAQPRVAEAEREGTNPTLATLVRLARALNAPLVISPDHPDPQPRATRPSDEEDRQARKSRARKKA